MNESKSFWTTLPGILTGIAMIIAATGGLIGGLYAAGIIGDGPEPAPAPAPTPAPAPAPTPAPAPPEIQPSTNQPPNIIFLDFAEHRIIGTGNIETVRVIAIDPENEGMSYRWYVTRGYIPEEGLITWKIEVDYRAPDSAGSDAISVNVTDVHDDTSTKEKRFIVYDQDIAEEAQGYLEQGIFLARINDYPGSMEQLTKLINIVPEFHEAHILRGQVYTKLEDYPQAISDYQMYIELEPTYMDAYLLLAKANLLFGDTEEASSNIKSFYSLAESMEPWRLEPLEPYEFLRTDRERLRWMNEAVSPGVLLPGL